MSEKVSKTLQNIDNYFNEVNLCRKAIAHDDSCLFRAVSEKLFFTQSYHERVKARCLEYMEGHAADYQPFMLEDMKDIVKQLKCHERTAGHLEMIIMSRIYRMDFYIYHPATFEQFNMTQNMFHNKIHLCYAGDGHYDLVYSKDFQQSVAICQSLLYELLYHNVFGLEAEADEAVVFLHIKKYRECSVSDVVASLGKEKLPVLERLSGRTFPPLPYRVAKALHPCIYRNVEFDIVHEEIREARSSKLSCFANFSVGDKCQVYLEDEDSTSYHGHIQELDKDVGVCVVYVEELAIKKSLPARCIGPLPVKAGNQGNYAEWPVAEIDLVRFQKRGRRRKTSGVLLLSDTHNIQSQDNNNNNNHHNHHHQSDSNQPPQRPCGTPIPTPPPSQPFNYHNRQSPTSGHSPHPITAFTLPNEWGPHQHPLVSNPHHPDIPPFSHPPNQQVVLYHQDSPIYDPNTTHNNSPYCLLDTSCHPHNPQPYQYSHVFLDQDANPVLHSLVDNTLVDTTFWGPIDAGLSSKGTLLEDNLSGGVLVALPTFPASGNSIGGTVVTADASNGNMANQPGTAPGAAMFVMPMVALPYGGHHTAMAYPDVTNGTADDTPLRFVSNTGMEYYRVCSQMNATNPIGGSGGGYTHTPTPALYPHTLPPTVSEPHGLQYCSIPLQSVYTSTSAGGQTAPQSALPLAPLPQYSSSSSSSLAMNMNGSYVPVIASTTTTTNISTVYPKTGQNSRSPSFDNTVTSSTPLNNNNNRNNTIKDLGNCGKLSKHDTNGAEGDNLHPSAASSNDTGDNIMNKNNDATTESYNSVKDSNIAQDKSTTACTNVVKVGEENNPPRGGKKVEGGVEDAGSHHNDETTVDHMEVGSDGDSGCPSECCTDLSPVSNHDSNEFVDSTTAVGDNSTSGVEVSKPRGKRRYYMYGNHKLIKPIKEIPQRFQTLLSETRAAKARCEGQPIYMQPSATPQPIQPYDIVYYQPTDDSQQQQQQQPQLQQIQAIAAQPLNANANCFIPGQGPDAATGALTFVQEDGMTSSMCPPMGLDATNHSPVYPPTFPPSSQPCPTLIVYSNNNNSMNTSTTTTPNPYLPHTSIVYTKPSPPTHTIQSIPMPPPPFPPPPSIPPPPLDTSFYPPPLTNKIPTITPDTSKQPKAQPPPKPLTLPLTTYKPSHQPPTTNPLVQSPMSVDGHQPYMSYHVSYHPHHHHPSPAPGSAPTPTSTHTTPTQVMYMVTPPSAYQPQPPQQTTGLVIPTIPAQ